MAKSIEYTAISAFNGTKLLKSGLRFDIVRADGSCHDENKQATCANAPYMLTNEITDELVRSAQFLQASLSS